jgi:predicted nucleic acid-binding protein
LPIVVSDSGPLIHLAQINRLQILQQLFGAVQVTPSVKKEVVNEGIRRKCPDAEIVGNAFQDGWLKVEALSAPTLKQAAKLSDGEGISPADAEVILLSLKKKALFLSDDIALAMIAQMYGLKTWGTWNLLLEALSNNLITITELGEAMEELGKRKFKLNPKRTQEIQQAAKLIEQRKDK